MKYILALIFFSVTQAKAQSDLVFNKRFIESEDRWVVFQEKDGAYAYGFIYIDAQAGLTMQHEGEFTISSAGKYIPAKLEAINMKVRLENNKVLVAFLPETRFDELKIKAVPDWLKFYKTDTASIERLYAWGFMYNGWEMCAKGLTYLERAQKINADFNGLAVELAFSYNCLEQYDKAISVLQSALVATPKDAYVHKELIYAELKSGQIEKAAASCKLALKVCEDKTYHAENCYNLLYEYYLRKDKKNFMLWLDETKKWTASQPALDKSVKAMEKEMIN